MPGPLLLVKTARELLGIEIEVLLQNSIGGLGLGGSILLGIGGGVLSIHMHEYPRPKRVASPVQSWTLPYQQTFPKYPNPETTWHQN